jgi:ribonuclease T2
LFLSTQFWDAYTGLEGKRQKLPDNKWTLHGLWPDFCNGSFTQYCDLNRQYDPSPPNSVPKYTGPAVDTFLAALGKLDLIDWMNK